MEQLQQYIRPELLVLIPVLYCVGMGLKKSSFCENRRIPLLLGLAGVLLALLSVLTTAQIGSLSEAAAAVFTAVTQGVLCAGASVYADQLIKQAGKRDE